MSSELENVAWIVRREWWIVSCELWVELWVKNLSVVVICELNNENLIAAFARSARKMWSSEWIQLVSASPREKSMCSEWWVVSKREAWIVRGDKKEWGRETLVADSWQLKRKAYFVIDSIEYENITKTTILQPGQEEPTKKDILTKMGISRSLQKGSW